MLCFKEADIKMLSLAQNAPVAAADRNTYANKIWESSDYSFFITIKRINLQNRKIFWLSSFSFPLKTTTNNKTNVLTKTKQT